MKAQKGSQRRICLGLAGLLLIPGLIASQTVQPKPKVIAPNEGDIGVASHGIVGQFKVGSLSTGASQLYMGLGILPPRTETVTHLHEVDEEVVYVLEGEITLTLNEEVYTIGIGGTAFIPPGTWMTIANRSNVQAKILGIYPRGDIEQCFRALYKTEDNKQTESERQQALALCKMQLPEKSSK